MVEEGKEIRKRSSPLTFRVREKRGVANPQIRTGFSMKQIRITKKENRLI
jgi:hypothetical protein